MRNLSDLGVLYVFLDGLDRLLRVHGVSREAVLCAWAITVEGRKVLLSLAHLKVPWRHRKFVQATNAIDGRFVEERRRTNRLPRFFTEKSWLKLVHCDADPGGDLLATH